ncbi:MAG: P1 family peptidase [Gemmatimonadales bacterium]|nr:P1 family peptidase [Gemmatimonadales bacterium]
MPSRSALALLGAMLFAATSSAEAQNKPRARELGIPFDGAPGPLNAITDVPGVQVGLVTLIREARVGSGAPRAVRTGVTAILPRGRNSAEPVFGGWFPLNGNGEMTGTTWLEESGFLEGPVMITNTHSVGVVRDAVVKWQVRNGTMYQDYSYPVVAETYDGWLNDINGFHVREADALAALGHARSGPVAEGNVGGGTGMICFEFKCGTGTASRRLTRNEGGYTVGVLVQANFGVRYQLQVAGVPVGRELGDSAPFTSGADRDNEQGSIIIVVATDAPLLPHQMNRVVKRAALGLARTGGTGGNGSGDIFIAFSTANGGAAAKDGPPVRVEMLPNERLNRLFSATILATEEAIINALVAGETMTGVDGHTVVAIPHDRLRATLKKYGRLR